MKTLTVAAALLAAMPLASVAPLAAAPVKPLPSTLGAQVNALLANAFPADGPGAVVLISRGGRTELVATRGLADVSAGRRLDGNTVFRLGSITKQFTAAMVLQLVAEKKLSLDDPLSHFFPDWPAPGSRATIRQLLNHSSGLQDYTKVPGWIVANRTKPTTTAALVDVMRGLPAKSPPGTAWEYNNGGYVMLGAIVEKVTGQPWERVMTDRIITPLGLRSFKAGVVGADPAEARGYTEIGGKQQPAELSHMSVPGAAGALAGSASDLAAWARALHHGKVVPPNLYREMIAPARLSDGTSEDYGFGLRLNRLRGQSVIAHGGALSGFNSGSAYIPSEDLFIAVLTNSDDPAMAPSEVAQRVGAMALGDPFPDFKPVQVNPASIATLLGVYGGDDGPPRRFFERDGQFFLARGEGQMQAIPAGQDRFYFGPGELTWLRFVRRPDGAHFLEIHRPEDARPRLARRTGAIPANTDFRLTADQVAAYQGTFATEGPTIVIAADGKGGLTATVAGNPPLPMRPLSATEFAVDAAQARVIMHPDAGGAVNRLTIRRGPRELNGKRVPPGS